MSGICNRISESGVISGVAESHSVWEFYRGGHEGFQYSRINPSRSEASCDFSSSFFYGEELLALPPHVGCPRLLIQYIRSYLPYLEAFYSIRNLRTRHAVMTRDPPNVFFTTHN
jgi:hypothetical protein